MTTRIQDRPSTLQGNGDSTVKVAEVVERATARKVAAEFKAPAEIEEKAQQFIDNYVAYLSDRTEAYVHRMATPQASDPVLLSGYQYWNCLTIGPIQFSGNPPYRPSKIVAAGEWTLMLGIVWVNPANGPGGSLSGTTVLGGRDYRVRFETINLSDVTNGPDRLFIGSFDSPANVINQFAWWYQPADPGLNPKLYETILTADIVTTGQPMAAFSTWHFDADAEPGFMQLPDVPPRWQHDIPARFLVYRK